MRQSLVADFEDFGYVRNPYDKCMMTLPGKGKLTDGIILIEVDDILEGGSARHQQIMDQFYKKCQCGKRRKLQELGDEGTLISGR